MAKGDHLLWIDGRQPPLILDTTAADFVSLIIDAMWRFQQGEGDESAQVVNFVVDRMSQKHNRLFRRKRVPRAQIVTDLHRVFGTLMAIAESRCPAEIGLNAKTIHYGTWNAPARMDLAVTYRCNLSCAKCYLPGTGLGPELTTEQWLSVYQILWRLGIPQVVFTGGEPTVREDIVELVSQADEFVTGLVTNGLNLATLAESFRGASLDYAQVTVESVQPKVHDQMTGMAGSHALTVQGIVKALETGLQVVTNTTLCRINAPGFVETVKWLAETLGIKAMACNTLICSGRGINFKKENGLSDQELRPILEAACAEAERQKVTLQWYSPTCYNRGINPLELGFGPKSCSAAGHNMTIQPDGSVLPCQSWPDAVGNILADDWAKIWNHPVCKDLREHALANAECRECGYAESCGGGCPLDDSPRCKGEGADQ